MGDQRDEREDGGQDLGILEPSHHHAAGEGDGVKAAVVVRLRARAAGRGPVRARPAAGRSRRSAVDRTGARHRLRPAADPSTGRRDRRCLGLRAARRAGAPRHLPLGHVGVAGDLLDRRLVRVGVRGVALRSVVCRSGGRLDAGEDRLPAALVHPRGVAGHAASVRSALPATGDPLLQAVGELPDHLLGDVVDDAAAHRRHATGELDVRHHRARRGAALLGERHLDVRLRVALAPRLLRFAGHARAVRALVALQHLDLPAVLHAHRAELHLEAHLVGVLGELVEDLRSRDAAGDGLDVHKRLPDLVDRGLDDERVLDLHGVLLFLDVPATADTSSDRAAAR